MAAHCDRSPVYFARGCWGVPCTGGSIRRPTSASRAGRALALPCACLLTTVHSTPRSCVCLAAAACPRRPCRRALHSTMLRFMPAFTCTRAVWLVLVLALYDHSPAAAATSTDTSAPASALCAFQTQAPVGFFRGFLLQHLKGVTLEQCAEACQARNKLGSDPSCRAFQYDSTAQKCGLKKVRARHHARLSCPALLSQPAPQLVADRRGHRL